MESNYRDAPSMFSCGNVCENVINSVRPLCPLIKPKSGNVHVKTCSSYYLHVLLFSNLYLS